MRDLSENHAITVVMVLHDLNQACAYADQVAVLASGRVLAHGRPTDAVTSETVRSAFGLDVAVSRDTDGSVTCIPLRRHRRTTRQPEQGRTSRAPVLAVPAG